MAQRIRILSPPNVPSRHQNFRLLFYGRLYNLHIHKSTQQDSVLSEECVQRILKCRSNVTQIVIVRWNISAALLLIKHTEKKASCSATHKQSNHYVCLLLLMMFNSMEKLCICMENIFSSQRNSLPSTASIKCK